MFFNFPKSVKDALVMVTLSGLCMIGLFAIYYSIAAIYDCLFGIEGDRIDRAYLVYLIPFFLASLYATHKIVKYGVYLELKHLALKNQESL
jgi:hypothetical protein